MRFVTCSTVGLCNVVVSVVADAVVEGLAFLACVGLATDLP